MRNRLITMLPVVLFLALFSRAAIAQDDKAKFKERYENNTDTVPFNSHDFTGYWTMTVLDHTLGTPAPPMTPAGKEAIKGRVGDTPGVPRALAAVARTSPDVHIAGNGLESNAPWLQCNPMGFPRLLNDDEPMEFVNLGNRFLQFFQWEHTFRELWLDGRALPSHEDLDNLGAAWYGHSVGQWEGDTLVVNTIGMDDRAWLDNLGYPKSLEARIEERYHRVDSNTIELQLTLFDPQYYTQPWVGNKKIYKRIPEKDMTYFGWKGLYAGITEGTCAPLNEVEGYHKDFAGPANDKK